MESSLFVGNPLQTSGAQTIQFLEGKAAGLKMIRMYNEAGLSMLVAPDRGMDIPELKVHGTNISFVSVTGFVNSTYFVEQGATGFMRNFNVGFLTTGGLSYMGAPKDPARGLHGTIGNTPAENFYHQDNGQAIVAQGDVREAEMFGVNLLLKRRITLPKAQTSIYLDDIVVNEGSRPAPLMMLYHMNFGYPFFGPETQLVLDPLVTTDRDGLPATDWKTFSLPKAKTEERVYFHSFKPDFDDMVQYKLLSPETGLQATISVQSSLLSVLNEWKLMQTKNYVLGLEPATNNVNGIEAAERAGTLKKLAPDEQATFDLRVDFSRMEV